jgi:hypothetical protein
VAIRRLFTPKSHARHGLDIPDSSPTAARGLSQTRAQAEPFVLAEGSPPEQGTPEFEGDTTRSAEQRRIAVLWRVLAHTNRERNRTKAGRRLARLSMRDDNCCLLA